MTHRVCQMRLIPHTAGRRSGLTLVEVIVILVILVILAGLLLPLLNGMIKAPSKRATCASNQRQVVIGMATYPTDSGNRYPALAVAPGRFDVADLRRDMSINPATRDAAMTTMSSFELLASRSGNDLGPKVFACPVKANKRAQVEALPGSLIGAPGLSWPSPDPNVSPSAYAYDWAVPENMKSSIRVILADRPIGNDRAGQLTNHRDKVVMTYADGHSCTVKASTASNTGNVVWHADDHAFSPYTGGPSFINPDANQDDIFSDDGDGADPTRFNRGSVSRCFLK